MACLVRRAAPDRAAPRNTGFRVAFFMVARWARRSVAGRCGAAAQPPQAARAMTTARRGKCPPTRRQPDPGRSARLAQRVLRSSDGMYEVPVVQRSERSEGFTTDHELADVFSSWFFISTR